ncbi:hypothetical protein [Acidisphaera sp. S103]|uniref:GumC family protein n=1 Tax=Acidisphaera sp. S103 TaxID=1747223 RepID=UPI00131CF0F2|nr:hypothetical protein [Acidisphaera sp. S103]
MNELHPARAAMPPPGDLPPQTDHGPAVQPNAGFSLRNMLVNLFYFRRLMRYCVIAGVLAGVVSAVLAHTYFTANSLLLVFIGSESATLPEAGTGQTTISVDGLKIVQSEIQIIQTDQVIRTAVEQIGPTKLYPGLTTSRLFGLLPPRAESTLLSAAIQEFRANLRVESEAGSNVLQISFTNPKREVAIRAVQALLDAYLAQRRTIYTNANGSFLDEQLARYKRQIGDLNGQIQKLRTDYDVLDIGQDIVLADNRLDGIVQRQNQVRERRVAVEAETTAVRANLATQPATVLSFRETTNNTGNDEARNTLVRLQQERTHLVQQYSPEWPAVKELDAKIRTVQAQMSGNGQALYFSQRDIRNPAIDVLNNRLAALEVEDKALNDQLVELRTQSQQAAQRVNQLREADGQLHSLTLSRDVAEGVFRQLSQQQPNVSYQESTVDQRNANLRVVQPPTASVIGHSLAISYFLGCVFLGLLLGLAAIAVASLLRHVYLMPDEAERELGLFDLGEFSLAGPQTALPDIQPDIAGIAAMLQDTTVDGRRVAALQVVGVAHADGKARLTRALAAEMAGGHGLRTLILDLQGDGNGQAKILNATVDVAASPSAPVKIAATSQPQLWVSLDAPQSVLGNPRSSIAGVRQVLDEMRQRYDVLLILVSTESSAHIMLRFARMVDANIMVVRAEQTRGVAAAQLRDTILSAGGNILGFVFVGRKFYVPAWIYRWI